MKRVLGNQSRGGKRGDWGYSVEGGGGEEGE